MKNITRFIIILAIAGAMIRACDVRITHYEDGSGIITYCLPLDGAGAYFGGCN